MWRSLLTRNLAWEVTTGNLGEPIAVRYPSWSWVSTHRPVHDCLIKPSDASLRPELLSSSIQLADQASPFGHVLGGELVFMATIIKSSKVRRKIAKRILFSIDCAGAPERLPRGLEFRGNVFHCFHIGQGPSRSACTYGLLLQSMGDGTFIRKGLIDIPEGTSKSVWMSRHARRMKVRII